MTNKVYDQREDLHELKKFKNDMTSNQRHGGGVMIRYWCEFCGWYFSNIGPKCPQCEIILED